MTEQKAKVVYDYKAEEPNQLTIKDGEMITLIGDVTPEGWILARNSKKKEGYIPDEYFERIGKPSKPKGPPPMPTSTEGNNTTSSVNNSKPSNNFVRMQSGSNSQKSSGPLGSNDVYMFYAYQYEWVMITLCMITAMFTFFYGTTRPVEHVYYTVLGIVQVLVTCMLMWVVGYRRYQTLCCCEPPYNVIGIYLWSALAFGGCWPIGFIAVCPLVYGCWVEYNTVRKGCKMLPDSITDDWKSQFCGGSCVLFDFSKLEIFTFILILIGDILCFIWGFDHGKQRARRFRKKSHDLKPAAFGVANGFGRIITVNLCLMLLMICHGCFSRQTKKLQREKRTDSRLYSCCSTLSNSKNRLFFHRVVGYNTVVAIWMHCMTHYFSYEQSGSEHTWIDKFGYESIGTGFALMFFFCIVLASASKDVHKQDRTLFNQTHLLSSVLMVFFIFWHGPKGLNNQWVFLFCAVPYLLYLLDAFFRWLNPSD